MSFRRIILCAFIAIVVSMVLTATPAQAQGDFVRGDVNCDNVVDGSDTTKLIFHLFMGSTIYCTDAADVNDDGQVSIVDLVALADFLWNTGPPPPAPYPNCGQDPTPDDLGCDSSCCTAVWECPITMTGDCNEDDLINSTDLIRMVNFVFKGGTEPLPCVGGADVNCSASVTSSDIVWLVNYVFKGGTPPCDVCTLMPDTWSCP